MSNLFGGIIFFYPIKLIDSISVIGTAAAVAIGSYFIWKCTGKSNADKILDLYENGILIF